MIYGIRSRIVPVPPDQAWNVLLEVEKVAPCMPGAQVDTVDGDDMAGRLKVKVGPVSLTYKGTATFKDRDTADRSVLVEASGKEMRGAGTASATVRAALSPENSSDSGTLVTLHTTLNVTGRPAQFGRGVIAEVGSRRRRLPHRQRRHRPMCPYRPRRSRCSPCPCSTGTTHWTC